MKQTLLRYYTQELASWVYLTPVVASFLGLIMVFVEPELAAYYILSISVTVLCATYFDMREQQLVMTSLFPISRKTFFIVDLLFVGRSTAYYTAYSLTVTMLISTLLAQQLTLPTAKQLFLSMGISIFIMALFFGLRRIKFGNYINFLIIVVPLLFVQLLPIISESTVQQCLLFFLGSFLLFIIAASFTYTRENRRDIA